MVIRAKSWRFGLSKTSFMIDLIQNIWKTNHVKCKLKFGYFTDNSKYRAAGIQVQSFDNVFSHLILPIHSQQSGSSSANQQYTMLIVFCWWADDGPALNAGWSALLNFPEGSILVFLRKPTVQLCDFAWGWSDHPRAKSQSCTVRSNPVPPNPL